MPAQHSPKWTIRSGQPADCPELLRIHQTAILGATDKGYSRAELESWAAKLATERYRESMIIGSERFFVASASGGGLVGFCSFHKDEMITLYVAPEWSKMGLGTALLSHAVAEIAANGHHHIRLTAALTGLSFYRGKGFRIIAESEEETRGGLTVRVFDMKRDASGPTSV